jgi:lysophospholipase L1-like esterase
MFVETIHTRRKWIPILVATAAVLAALLAIELGMRLFSGERPRAVYTIQRNSAYFSPELDDTSPLYYTYSGIVAHGKEINVHYPDGKFRRFQLEKPADTFRIVAVGDSITELWNLPGFLNYTSFLETAVKEHVGTTTEVIPLGVGGYNSWQQMHLYMRDFEALTADVMVLQFCPNDGDVMTLRPRPAGQAVPGSEWPRYEIVGTRYGRPDFDRYRIGPIQSRIWWLLAGRGTPSHELNGCVQVAGNDEQRKAIAWFRDLARAKQIPLVAVLFPMLVDDYSQPELAHVKSLLDEAGVPYLDLLPEFKKHGSLSTLGRDSYHPNDKGHELAAQAIFRNLEEKKFLDQGHREMGDSASPRRLPFGS